MPDKKIYLVSTSHLDREWYYSFEKFRIQVCHIINRVLELLSKYPEYRSFMLDGQVCPLLDYLEIYPEKEVQIKEYIKNGRFLIGPWFIQPDEAIPCGESHIRNLMMGDKISQSFGRKMSLGYLPDTFGHISQMPQILRGFGLDKAFFTRGIDMTFDRELIWKSPDDSSVTVLLLVYGGCSKANYSDMSNGIRLIDNSQELKEFLEKCIDSKHPNPTNEYTIVACCSDHAAPDMNIIKMISEINSSMDYEIEIASYEEYLNEFMASKPNLQVICGELRDSSDINVLKDTLASRAYLKRENNIAQKLLFNYAEPLNTIAWLEGAEYPEGLIDTALKYLLLNHTHDGICGCSIDDVHNEMMIRFKKCEDISSRLSELALKYIADRIDTRNLDADCMSMIVFNPQGFDNNGAVEVELAFKGKIRPYFVKIFDANGIELSNQIVEMRLRDNIETDVDVVQRFYREVKCKIAFNPGRVPAYGYKAFKVEPVYDINQYFLRENPFDEIVTVNKNVMENEYVRIEINNDGTFNIENKESFCTYRNIHYFIDEGDAGDVYTFQKPAVDTAFNSNSLKWNISLVSQGPVMARFRLEADMPLPTSLDSDKMTRSTSVTVNSIQYEISLYAGQKYASIKTVIDNYSSDHRIRVMFPSFIDTLYSYADSQFMVERRGIRKFPGLHPMQSFVDLSNGQRGLCIMTRGIHQYEVLKDGCNTLAITLLKCQNTLYRIFMTENEEFKGAQCIGRNVFEYAVYPHAGEWESAKCFRQSTAFNTEIYSMMTDNHKGDLPIETGFISIEPEELIITAFKKAKNGNGIILRFFNAKDRPIDGIIRMYKKIKSARLVNLNEVYVKDLNVNDNLVFINAQPHQIVTVEIHGVCEVSAIFVRLPTGR